ncbi:hypothetical protein GOV07_05345 [Candidatus Woesearchaeota archaeon]|nr:hypothetical protein [Candidatus Woesearchaeota archaeon]
MSIEGNLHGYIIRAVNILKDAKLRIEEERTPELSLESSWEYKLHADICNALLLLNGIEDLNDEEIVLLQDILKEQHEEDAELGKLLLENNG